MKGEGHRDRWKRRDRVRRRKSSGPEQSPVFLKSACLYNERITRTASERVCAACHGAKLIQVHSSSLTHRVSLSASLARRSPASSCLTIRKQWRGSTFKDCRYWAAHDNYHRARARARASTTGAHVDLRCKSLVQASPFSQEHGNVDLNRVFAIRALCYLRTFNSPTFAKTFVRN